jgi:hypothetical protein
VVTGAIFLVDGDGPRPGEKRIFLWDFLDVLGISDDATFVLIFEQFLYRSGLENSNFIATPGSPAAQY